MTKSGTINDLQLPEHVRPSSYTLQLKVDVEKQIYDGSVLIKIFIYEDCDFIVLNSSNLEVQGARLGNKPISWSVDREFLRFDSKFTKNELVELSIEFAGKFNDHIAGLYQSSYTIEEENEEKTRYVAATHFEPIDCRTVFPCFDQPDMRAEFEIILIVKSELTALSNMEVEKEIALENGFKQVVFKRSPPMPTYLVGLLIGQFDYVESKLLRIPIRVWSDPGKINKALYALELAEAALEFYEKQFKINYPLPKLDFVAIPDFPKLGMENFGLIFFKEETILVDRDTTSTNNKYEVAATIFHEVSHQWFGNLVTLKFWDSLWLKEGFADWMSWYAIDSLYPEWKPFQNYLVYDLQNSLTADALSTTHSVEMPIASLEDIKQGYDSISYAKGCSLIVMVAKWLGVDIFMEGVVKYLSTFSWKATTALDLWSCLYDVSGIDVGSAMEVWIKQAGFPKVTVEELDDNKIKISQRRFISNPTVTEYDDYLFPIFVNIRTTKEPSYQILLKSKEEIFELELEDDFFKVNSDQVGFYRTAYSEERWTKLGLAGVQGKLSVEDRIGLLADCAKLAESGYILTICFFELLKQWSCEKDAYVWDEAINDLFDIQDVFIFDNGNIFEGINQFMRNLIGNHIQASLEISQKDSYELNNFKKTIFSAGYSNGDPLVIKYCREKFASFTHDGNTVNADQRGVIFKCVAKYGGQEEYERLMEIYEEADDDDIADDALVSLGRFPKPDILQNFLQFVLDLLNEQDVLFALSALKNHSTGITTLWRFLRNDWESIAEKLGYGSETHIKVVNACLLRLATRDQKDEIESFFADKGEVFEKTVRLALERIDLKVQWVERDGSKLREWFKTNLHYSDGIVSKVEGLSIDK